MKHIKRMANAGSVSVYGDDFIEISQLCKNTNAFIRGQRAIGALKTYEENEKANEEADDLNGSGLAIGSGEMIPEIEEETKVEEPGLMKRSTLFRRNTVVRKQLLEEHEMDGETLNQNMRQRNMSMAMKPGSKKPLEMITPRSDPESAGLLD